MCGIVGLIRPDMGKNELTAFKHLLDFDTERGEHSTGVVRVQRHSYQSKVRDAFLMKTVGVPANLYKRFPDMFSTKGVPVAGTSQRIDVLIGHNRYKTRGEINATNAHPFQQGHLFGVHNGTIDSGLNLLPTGPGLKGTTDSEQIYYALAQGWSLQDIFAKLRGAATLVWWDAKAEELHLYRNSKRPLFIMPLDKGGFMWASEDRFIVAAAALAKIPDAKIESIPMNKELVYGFGNYGGSVVKVREADAVLESTPPAPRGNYHAPNSHAWMWDTGWRQNYNRAAPRKTQEFKPREAPKWLQHQHQNARSAPLRSVGTEKPKVITHQRKEEATEVSKTFQGGWVEIKSMDRERFLALTEGGCLCCQDDLDYGDFTLGKIKFLEAGAPLCGDCAGEWSK